MAEADTFLTNSEQPTADADIKERLGHGSLRTTREIPPHAPRHRQHRRVGGALEATTSNHGLVTFGRISVDRHCGVALLRTRCSASRAGRGRCRNPPAGCGLAEALHRAVDEELTERQRRVFVAIVVQGVPLDPLVVQLGSNRNAIHKTMFDARRKLRAALTANEYLNTPDHPGRRIHDGHA